MCNLNETTWMNTSSSSSFETFSFDPLSEMKRERERREERERERKGRREYVKYSDECIKEGAPLFDIFFLSFFLLFLFLSFSFCRKKIRRRKRTEREKKSSNRDKKRERESGQLKILKYNFFPSITHWIPVTLFVNNAPSLSSSSSSLSLSNQERF